MFGAFLKFFEASDLGYLKQSDDLYLDVVYNYSKQDFGNGLFRIVDVEQLDFFRDLARSCFKELPEDSRVLGFDWLGRFFVVSAEKDDNVLLCDAGAHEILEIPVTIQDFLNQELPAYSDAVLASVCYQDYLAQGGVAPTYQQCVAYKIPLFLGGEDSLSNLELTDLDVFWWLMAQLGQ